MQSEKHQLHKHMLIVADNRNQRHWDMRTEIISLMDAFNEDCIVLTHNNGTVRSVWGMTACLSENLGREYADKLRIADELLDEWDILCEAVNTHEPGKELLEQVMASCKDKDICKAARVLYDFLPQTPSRRMSESDKLVWKQKCEERHQFLREKHPLWLHDPSGSQQGSQFDRLGHLTVSKGGKLQGKGWKQKYNSQKEKGENMMLPETMRCLSMYAASAGRRDWQPQNGVFTGIGMNSTALSA